MTITCGRCSRTNPPEAQFCYFDGAVLAGAAGRNGPLHMGTRPFPRPFVFPSGRQCHNFDELALACQDEGVTAIKLLQSGDLPSFLSGIGRSDLAQAGRAVMAAPNKAIGFDGFLATLPSTVLAPPTLAVEPAEINLGDLRVGEDRNLTLHLFNRGMRLIHGHVYCESAPWLSIGDATGVHERLFQFSNEQELQLFVRGDKLVASPKMLEARVSLRSSGGEATVLLRGHAPVTPFAAGILKGCMSPRQIAELARLHPREAAEFFESGAVEKWYRANGWSYPVTGPASSGLGAIQQFFEALGLAKPPRVELSISRVSWQGRAGESLRQSIEIRTAEKRNVFAVAHSNQPWLKVQCGEPRGQMAPLELFVPSVPDSPGGVLDATVSIQSNGNQRFEVPVQLTIAGTPRARTISAPHSPNVFVALPEPVEVPSEAVVPAQADDAIFQPTVNESDPVSDTGDAVLTAPLLARSVDRADDDQAQTTLPSWLIPLAPLAMLLIVLGMCLPIHDFFFVKPLVSSTDDDADVIDARPRVEVRMHNKLGVDLLPGAEEPFDYPTERFGVVMSTGKKLTYDLVGRSNNVVIRIDGEGPGHEFLFGHSSGKWIQQLKELGKDDSRERYVGYQSVWALHDRKIPITQTIELVAGGAAPESNRRYYDTCLVTYKIENNDSEPHKIGLRFMLDTFIGANDGVPFTLPGSSTLCDTSEDFSDAAKVPDYIEARERSDFKDPGTIARLQLRLGTRYEPPSRVTLGAWPNEKLRGKDARCHAQLTLWDVPVLPIKTIQNIVPAAEPDSCVIMYWPEKELAPGKSREMAFAYGLGNLASDKDGKLGLTVPPTAVRGTEFSVTVLVKNPAPGQKVTLELPNGLELRGGASEQEPKTGEADSPVTWKVRANISGSFNIEVKSSTGGSVSKKLRVKDKDIFN
jgi:hypothetical protein